MCGITFEERFNRALKKLPLNTIQLEIIRDRYLTVVMNTQVTYRIAAFTYNLFIWIITLGSVSTAVTSALGQGTVGNTSQSAQTVAYFWVGIALPLAVALANKWLYIFNIHQKYMVSEDALSKLYSEGWSFVSAVGVYQPGNYTAKFNIFCTRIENIQSKITKIMISIQNNDGGDGTPQSVQSVQTVPSTVQTVQQPLKNNVSILDNIADITGDSTYDSQIPPPATVVAPKSTLLKTPDQNLM